MEFPLDSSEEIVYTPGVIRFTGSQTNELSNTGLQLNQGIIVESGMKNGAQICTTAVQIMQGSTLKLLASDQIGDNASLQLKTAFSAGEIGGNFLLNGFNERVGTLFLYNDAATGIATTSFVIGNGSGRKDITAPCPNFLSPFIDSIIPKFFISALDGVALRLISIG